VRLYDRTGPEAMELPARTDDVTAAPSERDDGGLLELNGPHQSAPPLSGTMAGPIEIVHPDKPHSQRDIETAMLESAMSKSAATTAMLKSAAAEYEELGKIKSVAEYRAWVSAFKRREQMALAAFAAAGSSSGLVPGLEHVESSRADEGLIERRIESIIEGRVPTPIRSMRPHVDPTFKNDLEAAYAQDDMETLRTVTALVQQQREEESKAKKQKTGKNEHDEEKMHVPFSMLELMVEARAAGGAARG
jgi:hypothetical protein